MGSVRVVQPRLPPLPTTAIAASARLTPLQDALLSVLQRTTVASEHCMTLINVQNSSRSLPEWNAAHNLLVIAVTDGHVDPKEPDDQLFFWRDRLYCTVSDLPIYSHQDKLVVLNCLRRAQHLKLIHSADSYIQSIHVRRSVSPERFVLKNACITLFERLSCLNATVNDLRASFDAYRQQQLYSNVIAIALKLISIAGGAHSVSLSASSELCGGLSGTDVFEYALSTASAILEKENFSKLSERKQAQLVHIFEEYGFTADQVRSLFYGRRSFAVTSISKAPLEASSFNHSRYEVSSRLNPSPAPSVDANDHGTDQNASSEDSSSQHESCEDESNHIDSFLEEKQGIDNELQTQRQRIPRRCDSTLETIEFAINWTHFVLNPINDNEPLFNRWNECLKRFLQLENISPRTLRNGTPSNILRFAKGAKQFVQLSMHPTEWKIGYSFKMVQFVHQYVKQRSDQRTPSSDNSKVAIIEMAKEWTQFILTPRNDHIQLQSSLNSCLVQFLEDHKISPQSLRFGLSSEICEIQDAVERYTEKKLGERMKLGYYFKLTQFVCDFSKNG
ncbi:hypothetical protein FGB62_297g08 [Gracilaria domingensis]|nr:hypothetical protein FGB62_297g08 [Gracilaria domingensis]